jgi:hypothetical protein
MPVVIREFMRETVDIRAVYKLGYMLETPVVSCATHSYEFSGTQRKVKMRQVRSISRKGRCNAPESSETIRQAPRFVRGEDMVRSAWRHAEPGRNALAPGTYAGGNNNVGPYPMQP